MKNIKRIIFGIIFAQIFILNLKLKEFTQQLIIFQSTSFSIQMDLTQRVKYNINSDFKGEYSYSNCILDDFWVNNNSLAYDAYTKQPEFDRFFPPNNDSQWLRDYMAWETLEADSEPTLQFLENSDTKKI